MTEEKLAALEKKISEIFSTCRQERLDDALILWVEPENLIENMKRLKDHKDLDFKLMIDLTAVHYPKREKPFEVVYQLLSVYKNHRLRVKLAADEATMIPSVTEVWNCANWYEREAYEMFGLLFSGHPDLRRLLTEYDFNEYPLRKDYPVEGRYEMRYDKEERRVVREPTALNIQNREFYG
ncbi:complex I 30 kDa subunit family protein [Magnetococcales bacterium HHB-1]